MMGDYSIVSIQGLSNRLPPPFFKFHIHDNRSGPLGENTKTPRPVYHRLHHKDPSLFTVVVADRTSSSGSERIFKYPPNIFIITTPWKLLKGYRNWYWWILERVGCKTARACECISKPTSVNIHQYQFNNGYLPLFYITNFFFKSYNVFQSSLFQVLMNWWYCILRQSVQYRSQIEYATGCTRCKITFLWKETIK